MLGLPRCCSICTSVPLVTPALRASRDMWFVLERLDPMPVAALLQAGRMLADGLRRLAPELRLSVHLFDADQPGGRAVPGW